MFSFGNALMSVSLLGLLTSFAIHKVEEGTLKNS